MRYTISDKEELTMSRQTKQHSQQFKQDAVKYVLEHPDLTNEECAKNLGIGLSTLSRWKKQYNDNEGIVPTRGSGNYSSDEAKEIARLKRKLRDAEDALDVLKKAISIRISPSPGFSSIASTHSRLLSVIPDN